MHARAPEISTAPEKNSASKTRTSTRPTARARTGWACRSTGTTRRGGHSHRSSLRSRRLSAVKEVPPAIGHALAETLSRTHARRRHHINNMSRTGMQVRMHQRSYLLCTVPHSLSRARFLSPTGHSHVVGAICRLCTRVRSLCEGVACDVLVLLEHVEVPYSPLCQYMPSSTLPSCSYPRGRMPFLTEKHHGPR